MWPAVLGGQGAQTHPPGPAHTSLGSSRCQGLSSPGKQSTAWAPHLQSVVTLAKSMDVPWVAGMLLLSTFSLHSVSLDRDAGDSNLSISVSGAKAVAAPQCPTSHMGTQHWFCRGVSTDAPWQPHLPSSGRNCPALQGKGTAPSLLALGSGFQWWLYCKESRGLKCTCHLSACNYIL